jgi:hypothetical protein
VHIGAGLLLGLVFVFIGWEGPELQAALAASFPGVVDAPSSDPLAYALYWQFAALGFSAIYAPLGMFLHEDRRGLGLAMYLFLVPVFFVNFYLAARAGASSHVSASLSLVPIVVFALRDWWLGWGAPSEYRYWNPERRNARTDFVIIDLPAVLSSGVLVAYIASHAGRQGLDLFYLGAVAFELFVVNALFVARSFDRARRDAI